MLSSKQHVQAPLHLSWAHVCCSRPPRRVYVGALHASGSAAPRSRAADAVKNGPEHANGPSHTAHTQDEDNLREALRYSAAMLGELRTSYLSPQKYYELYMLVFDQLSHLEVRRAVISVVAKRVQRRARALRAASRDAAVCAARATSCGSSKHSSGAPSRPPLHTPTQTGLLRRRARQGAHLRRAVRARAARGQRAAAPVSSRMRLSTLLRPPLCCACRLQNAPPQLRLEQRGPAGLRSADPRRCGAP